MRRLIHATSIAGVLLALAGPSQAQPAPRPLTVLDVPYISQSEALCGGAAAAMVLRYWGERGLTAETFAHLVDRSAAGIRTTALIAELRQRGWNATGIVGTDETMAVELSRGRPVLTLIQDRPGTFHYIVVVAAAREAIVFHDPARAPMRVMSREEFEGRWRAADRWMAVVVPGASRAEAETAAGVRSPAETPCDRLLADGVAAAQSGDLATAEVRLTAALDCAPPAALRELAGVRLLQQRWADVESLAAAAVDLDPSDAHAWRLLGTSRFLQNDRLGALDAWNRASEPRLDLIRIDGLERTRQRVVEDYLGLRAGGALTATSFVRARRRLDAFPAAASASLNYVPVPSGLAEVRATIVERHAPSGLWSYVAIGAIAAARREVEYSLPTLTGGGDRLTAGWRFWPGRPRYSAAFTAPAPWGGIWSASLSAQRERFDDARLPPSDRTNAELRISNWVTPIAHVAIRGGMADWTSAGTVGGAGLTLRLQSLDDRVQAQVSVDAWSGGSSFGLGEAALTARSSAERRGRVYVGRLHAGMATTTLPPDAWLAGDVGTTRAPLLRAHPLVADGRLKVAQLGRRLLAGSVELQHWWARPLARLGAAGFIDAARIDSRAMPGGRGDVDAGAGFRLGLPGVAGTFRADLAKGLRDGATTFSFVYEP